ncbi:MarR family transcriptional regulator [Vibrio tapetis subsp. quintayensis]|uniref:MarR family winged helix-turn-helix transcriptional regulator n=1 Tax=Vibrio tapetis TaxID=52443 RepID=UPI0025B33A0D|nr:MarR family transcriptional regulator [Vibrio tapetis]MDN3678784.1 MarR family transcriptional regulator [Vibrio tapetis subsp. quintayensis]
MDAVDKIIGQWAIEKPELETKPMALIGRLLRLSKHIETKLSEFHKSYDLKMGEFDVLATLRRSGSPYRLTPSALMNTMMLTSGAMTNRLDKLESKGLIIRSHSKEDRRSVSVELSKDGYELIDDMMKNYVQIQQELVSDLSLESSRELDQYLKLWLNQFEK